MDDQAYSAYPTAKSDPLLWQMTSSVSRQFLPHNVLLAGAYSSFRHHHLVMK